LSAQHQSQIDQFAFPPTSQPARNLFAKPDIWNESIVKLAPTGVPFAIVPGRPSTLRQCDKAPIVKTHQAASQASANTAERQIKKRTFGIAIGCSHQADVITAHIEKKRGRHQIGVAHVVVFVFVQTFEPATIRDRILLVVMAKPICHIFAC
jgi:hypothetical protein